jgi:hypothetical protein
MNGKLKMKLLSNSLKIIMRFWKRRKLLMKLKLKPSYTSNTWSARSKAHRAAKTVSIKKMSPRCSRLSTNY